jgi:hypothetical protein
MTALSAPLGETLPPPSGVPRTPARPSASGKEDHLARLRQIEGQVQGLQRMIDEDRWARTS